MSALAGAFTEGKPLGVFPEAAEAPAPAAPTGTSHKHVKLSKEEQKAKDARTLFIGNVTADMPRNAIIAFIRDGVQAAMQAEGAEIGSDKPTTEGAPEAASTDAAEKKEEADEAEEGTEADGAAQEGKDDNVEVPSHRRGGGIVASVRIRSFGISKMAVAPGSTFKGMLKAAYVTGSYDGEGAAPDAAAPAAPAAAQQATAHEAAAPAANAYVVLTHRKYMPYALGLSGKVCGGRHVRVDVVGGRPGLGDGTGGKLEQDPKKTLFLGHLPWSADEEALWTLLLPLVKGGADGIRYIRLLRDRVTRKSKGVAYVGLAHAGAVAAVARALDGTKLEGKAIKAGKCLDKAAQSKARGGRKARGGGRGGRGGQGRGAYGRLHGGTKRPSSHMGPTPGADLAASSSKRPRGDGGKVKANAVGKSVASAARKSAARRKAAGAGKR